MSWADFFDWITNAAPGAMLPTFVIVILVGAVREWWVWGFMYRREVAEKEYWREKALSSLGLVERAATTAAAATVSHLTEGDQQK